MEYRSQDELDASLKEWQTRLFLDDWIIKVRLMDKRDMRVDDALGYCWRVFERKSARIDIAMLTDDMRTGELIKPCHEQILVHELLHCKRFTFDSSDKSIESCAFDMEDHAFIEQMAKSLIMAKYNILLDWFKNF